MNQRIERPIDRVSPIGPVFAPGVAAPERRWGVCGFRSEHPRSGFHVAHAADVSRCGAAVASSPCASLSRQRFPRPSVMGVVNVTPDSFSDGGVNLDPAAARARRAAHARRGRRDRRRRRRVDPARVRRRDRRRGAAPRRARCWRRLAGEVPVSIDTAKAEVARRALELGAELVNDVTALRGDPELAGVVADAGAYLCLMHMQGEPRTMQADPRYDDVVDEVEGVPRGAARASPTAAGRRRGARVPRSRHRLRQDRRAQLRARPAARRADRARPPGRHRLLAQELARASSSATRTRRPGRSPRASASPSPPTSAAPTILRAHDVREHVEALAAARAVLRVTFTVELHGLRVPGRHGVAGRRARARPATSSSTSASTSPTPRSPTGSRTPSTTATSPQCVREVSDGRRYHLLEALAARGRGRDRSAASRSSGCACACASRTSRSPACSLGEAVAVCASALASGDGRRVGRAPRRALARTRRPGRR